MCKFWWQSLRFLFVNVFWITGKSKSNFQCFDVSTYVFYLDVGSYCFFFEYQLDLLTFLLTIDRKCMHNLSFLFFPYCIQVFLRFLPVFAEEWSTSFSYVFCQKLGTINFVFTKKGCCSVVFMLEALFTYSDNSFEAIPHYYWSMH